MNKPKLSDFPQTPGVYIYRDLSGVEIYVGKAKNLRSRLSSYFDTNIEPKTRAMLDEAVTIDYIKVSSDFESELLEASLVRKYMPKYNIELKDDKSPLYIGITKDRYPRIVYLRRTQIDSIELSELFGPFKSSLLLRRLMKKIRRVFPYSDHKLGKKKCLYSQIGLCVPCPNGIESILDLDERKKVRRKYLWNISKIKKLLLGDIGDLLKDLDSEMRSFSRDLNYEMAAEIRRDIELLQSFMIPKSSPSEYLENPNLITDIRNKELIELSSILSRFFPDIKISRIECFDIAHISGNQTTASMVTFIDGEAEKKLYRHYKIRSEHRSDDYSAMREVITRRAVKFEEIGLPDLIIIDGGKGQVSAVSEILNGKVPFVGLAKRFETLVIPRDSGFEEVRLRSGHALHLVQRIRDEAHRFARRYHHHLVAKSLMTGNTKMR